MVKNRLGFFFFLLVTGLLLSSCNNSTTPLESGPSSQSAELRSLQTQVHSTDSIADFLTTDAQILDDVSCRADDDGSMAKIDTSIGTLHWGRHIFWGRITDTTTTALEGDSVAIVTVIRTVPAELRIGIQNVNGTGLDSVIKKPFVLHVDRRVRFVRVARSANPDSNWKPCSISMAYGRTTPEAINTFSISSMEIDARIDTTLTSPLSTFFRYGRGVRSGIPQFMVGDTARIRVTVQSRNDSGEIVVLRHGEAGFLADRHRMKMSLVAETSSTGNFTRVYERTFVIRPVRPSMLSVRLTASVDVFSHGSIHDPGVEVANEFWGIPYIVTQY